AFSSAVTGTAATAPTVNYSGTHGYFNGDRELDGIFVASGAGIKRGVKVDRVRNLDVAPTIAHLLGLQFGPVDGMPMTELLTAGR
ncbi:MAG TPA: hypothetical protein VGE76_07340, partial [Opitutaceae bacterium]